MPGEVKMHQFFVKSTQIKNYQVTIGGSDAHHISRVLRLGSGEQILVVDDYGREFAAELKNVTHKEVQAQIKENLFVAHEPPLDVYLIQGMPKNEKMDLIIQKCTEIGVKGIFPVEMKRTIIKLSADKKEKRQVRWQRIAMEAAKQCQRTIVPKIFPICDFPQALTQLPLETLLIMPWEEEKTVGLKRFLRNGHSAKKAVALIIGPEGGITTEEVNLAIKRGARTVSLGPRILRTETAGLVALTMILYELGDLGGNILG